MEENRNIFDDQLSKALSGLSGEVNPGDWERISSALDRIDAGNAQFDENLKESVTGLEGEVQDGDWNHVESALDRRRRRVAAIWWSTAALLLITAGLWGISSLNDADVNPVEQIVTEQHTGEKITGDDPVDQGTGTVDQAQVGDRTGSDNTGDNTMNQEGQPEGSDVSEKGDQGVTDGSGTDRPDNDGIGNRTDKPAPDKGTPETEGPKETPLVKTKPPFEIRNFDLIIPAVPVVLPPIELADIIDVDYNAKDYPLPKETNMDPDPGQSSVWEIGIHATPNAGLLQSVVNKDMSWLLNPRYFDVTGDAEGSATGYSFGFNVLRHFGNNLYLSTGINYSQKVERVAYDYTITTVAWVDRSAETARFDLRHPAQFEQVEYDGINTFNFVEIPIKLGTIVSLGQFSNWALRAEAGFSVMGLVNASGKKPDQTSLYLFDLNSYDNLSKIAMGMEVKSGIYYNGFDRFRIGGGPSFAMGLTSMYTNDAPTKLRPYNYGFNFSANYLIFGK